MSCSNSGSSPIVLRRCSNSFGTTRTYGPGSQTRVRWFTGTFSSSFTPPRPEVFVDGRLDRAGALREGGAPESVQSRLAGRHLDDNETNAVGCGEDRLDVCDFQLANSTRQRRLARLFGGILLIRAGGMRPRG